MCCLTENCTPSAWPLDLTLIRECTLRITSYKYYTLSPWYHCCINHSNWEGVLWIEENTGHTVAVIPLSLKKLTHYTGCFWIFTIPKRSRQVRPHHPLAIFQNLWRRAWGRELGAFVPAEKKHFKNNFEPVHMWMTSMWIQWDVIWRTVIFMASFFAAHNLSFLRKQMRSACAEGCSLC